MSRRPLLLLTVGAAVALATVSSPYSGGAIPGLHIPPGATRTGPACGGCHLPFTPGGGGLQVTFTASARSIALGQVVQLTTAATGGAAGSQSGFVSETTGGSFQSGPGMQTDPTGSFIGHSAPGPRSWTYALTAPSTPGPIELYTVINTVDGSRNFRGDVWGFHGWDPTATINTPIRLYVNAVGVTAFGDSCSGSYDNVPVLGSSESPTVGNAAFALSVVNTAAAVPGSMFIGIATPPIDLALIGAAGCTIDVAPFTSTPFTTSGGSSQFADGAASLGMAIPPDPSLAGFTVAAQAVLADGPAGRALPITVTNALSIQVQPSS